MTDALAVIDLARDAALTDGGYHGGQTDPFYAFQSTGSITFVGRRTLTGNMRDVLHDGTVDSPTTHEAFAALTDLIDSVYDVAYDKAEADGIDPESIAFDVACGRHMLAELDIVGWTVNASPRAAWLTPEAN